MLGSTHYQWLYITSKSQKFTLHGLWMWLGPRHQSLYSWKLLWALCFWFLHTKLDCRRLLRSK